MDIKKILTYIVIWRIILLIVAWMAMPILPFKDSFPYREVTLEPLGDPLLYSWANFDGVHYVGIAAKGYWAQFTQAFFPVYPFMMGIIDTITGNSIWSGLIISHICLVGALYLLYTLVRLGLPKYKAKDVILLLLLFPTSFYLGAVYTESLFLVLVLGSFWMMRQNKFWLAASLIAMATGTRIIGVCLVPALMWEYWLATTRVSLVSRVIQLWALVFASLSGLLGYMYYLHTTFGDALYFLHAQPAFGAARSSDKIILLYQVIYRYIKMLVTVEPQSLLYYTVTQEFIISIIFFVLCILAFKYVRRSYALFALGAYLIPTLTGTFSSMPRYVLVLFPAFMVLAQIRSSKKMNLLYIISFIFLIINTILFTRGYWVA